MKEKYIKNTIKEAEKALNIGEMPVGAIIVYKNNIVSRGYNKKESKNNSLMHAEIIAIDKACKKIGDWRLNDCELYVTMEPCNMCMGAIVESRIKTVYYGVKNEKTHDLNKLICSNEKIKMIPFDENTQINDQLNLFFKAIRNKSKQTFDK